VDFEGIAESIAAGEGTGSIMPGPYELGQALQYNYLLFVVPFVFYAFGWAFHILLELKNQFKLVFLGLLIAVTFTVDFLLAMIISNNTENAKQLMGLSTTPWSQSPSFYIILFLGFLVYVIWSILLDSLLREWDKKEITNNLKKIIRHLTADIKILKSKTGDVAAMKKHHRRVSRRHQYGNDREPEEIHRSILFGMDRLPGSGQYERRKDKCLVIKREFEDKNDIKKRNGEGR